MKFVIAVFATIVMGSGADAFTAGVRRSARVASVSVKDKIAGELDIPCEEECALESYPNMPPSVHPGVVTGQALVDLLEDAKKRGELSVEVKLCRRPHHTSPPHMSFTVHVFLIMLRAQDMLSLQ